LKYFEISLRAANVSHKDFIKHLILEFALATGLIKTNHLMS